MASLIVYYNPHTGLVLPDGQIEEFVSSQITQALKLKKLEKTADLNCEVTIGSELMLLAFRTAIANGLISSNEIEFWYEGYQLQVSETGCLLNTSQFIFTSLFDKFVRMITTARRK